MNCSSISRMERSSLGERRLLRPSSSFSPAQSPAQKGHGWRIARSLYEALSRFSRQCLEQGRRDALENRIGRPLIQDPSGAVGDNRAPLPGNCAMPSIRWTPIIRVIRARAGAGRQPIAATRNESASSMLPRTLFGISSCNGSAAALAGRSMSSRTTAYRWRCARRWE